MKTPIATGERLVGPQAFRELLEKRACSVIQPDITHCGGLSEARRIAAMAEAYRVALAPHNPQGPVSTAASLEFGFATPSYIICEAVHCDVPWRDEDVVRKGSRSSRKGRIVRPNTRPGLGHRDQRGRSRRSIRSSRSCCSALLHGRQRGRLVAVAEGVDSEAVRGEHRYEHLTWPEVNEAVATGEGDRAPGRLGRAARAPPSARRGREARVVGLPRAPESGRPRRCSCSRPSATATATT